MLLHVGLSEKPPGGPRRIIVSALARDLPGIEQRVGLTVRMGQQPFRIDLDRVERPLSELGERPGTWIHS